MLKIEIYLEETVDGFLIGLRKLKCQSRSSGRGIEKQKKES